MINNASKIPKKYQPKGFQIIHDDKDIIVGVKSAGLLTVSAKWEKNETVHQLLNRFVRKGNPHSKKNVFVVHRLDQATSGLLVFAKTEEAQEYLKDHWSTFNKFYYAIVHGRPTKTADLIESYLEEDEDYRMHSSESSETGKLARTEYEVLHSTARFSVIKVRLLTGRKNQIRVHLAQIGCPIVGDTKYGQANDKHRFMALHSYQLEINHPYREERLIFQAKPPTYFNSLVDFSY